MKTHRKLKKHVKSSKLVLEEIIGLTTKNGNGLASNISSANFAYTAGCVVVVYNVGSGTQSHLMVSHRLPKPLSCVAMSTDGRFVAAGESGPQPAVLVWDCTSQAFVSELKGHLYGVACIAFSPDGKHLVSVGGYIYLWDWRSGTLVTKLKANSSCSAVSSVNFSRDAKFIVTAGKKHLKFWKVGSSPRTRLNAGTGSLAIHGKPVDLGPQKGSSFVSVTACFWSGGSFVNGEQASDLFPIYALTETGVLCLVHSGFSLRKSFDLKVRKGFSVSASNKLVACACSDGIVQLLASETLKYEGSVIYSKSKKSLGEIDVVCCPKSAEKGVQISPALPDAIACQFSTSDKLVVVYEDHSLYIWDIHDVNQATRCCVLVSHSACIWDIKNLCCENMHDPSLACVARGCSGGVSFATCSADGTIRLWDLVLQPDPSEDAANHHSLDFGPVGTTHLVSAGIFERGSVEAGVGTQEFRSLAISSDGKFLSAGDCEGNLHIYNLQTSEYTCFQGAHDAEILSLSFSLSSKKVSEEAMDSQSFLASGGRDRMIHLYDVKRNFDLIESIDDHSAAVTSVKIACNGCKILSCSADRSLVFRDVATTDSGHMISRHHHLMASHGTVYDMAVDPAADTVVTVGQDKKINTFDIASGKLIRSFRHDKDFGEPIKVTMDPSGSYLVCSYSNKSISVYDFISGEMVAQAMGHGEVITGVIFVPDCKHIISVGGDGCIFVWKVPAPLSSRMLQKMKENLGSLSPSSLAQSVDFSQILFYEEKDEQCRINAVDVLLLGNSNQTGKKFPCQSGGHRETSTFKFSISRLPRWAQAKVKISDIVPSDLKFTLSQKVDQKYFSPVGDGHGYASMSPEAQILSDHNMGGSESCISSLPKSSPNTNKSESSPIPQETPSIFSMDKRWRSIYTVCLDLLNSPEMRTLMDTNMTQTLSSSNLRKDADEVGGNGQCSLKNGGQLGTHNTTKCYEVVARDVAENLHSIKTGSELQVNMDVKICDTESEESDLFRQHFGNLSTTHKTEIRKSSARRRYSTKYVVHRDYLGDRTQLFGTPVLELAGKTLNCQEEAAMHVRLEDASFHVLEEQKMDEKNSVQSMPSPSFTSSESELAKVPVMGSSKNFKLTEARDQKKCAPIESEVEKRILACKEALLGLNAAAENTVDLFSTLGILGSSEEFSGERGAKLYDEAAELLQSITGKVNSLARLMQSRKLDSCGSRLGFQEVSLERLKENLS